MIASKPNATTLATIAQSRFVNVSNSIISYSGTGLLVIRNAGLFLTSQNLG